MLSNFGKNPDHIPDTKQISVFQGFKFQYICIAFDFLVDITPEIMIFLKLSLWVGPSQSKKVINFGKSENIQNYR